ncbi:MAG: hypothetical protein AAGF77_06160, partial [Bacteroidota bacterium]
MNSKYVIYSIALFIAGLVNAQREKTITERFFVNEETVLHLNTVQTDITFKTWDKDEVEIVATAEIEGASEEEAEAYFESSPFRITGNREKITVSSLRSGHTSSWHWSSENGDH